MDEGRLFAQSILPDFEKHCMQLVDVKFGVDVGKAAFANLSRLVEQNQYGYDLKARWVIQEILPVLACYQALCMYETPCLKVLGFLRDELMASARKPGSCETLWRWVPFPKRVAAWYVKRYFYKSGVCSRGDRVEVQRQGRCVQVRTNRCDYCRCLQQYHAGELCGVLHEYHGVVLKRIFPKLEFSMSGSCEGCCVSFEKASLQDEDCTNSANK